MKNFTRYGHLWVSNGTNALCPFVCQKCGALSGTSRARRQCDGVLEEQTEGQKQKFVSVTDSNVLKALKIVEPAKSPKHFVKPNDLDDCAKCGKLKLQLPRCGGLRLQIPVKDLTEKRRYALILKAVQNGLHRLGVEDVKLSEPTEEHGQLVFEIVKGEFAKEINE